MKYSKHWKLEVFITAVSFILILYLFLIFTFLGKFYLCLIFGILPIFLIRHYHYPFLLSAWSQLLVYILFLLTFSWSSHLI